MKRWRSILSWPSLEPAQLTTLLVVGVLGAFLVWGAFAHVEQRARAPGQVIAQARTQFIQSAIDGIVSGISVKEGQRVERGELIATLDRIQAEAAVDDSRAKVAALKSALVRLRAEVLGTPLTFPPEVQAFPVFVETQTALFRRRQQALNEELQALNAVLNSVRQEYAISEPLLKTGDISEVEVIRLRKSVSELQGTITNRRNKFLQDAQAEMTKAEEDLATQAQVLTERTDMLARTEIRAPANGIVRNIRLTTQGARVRPGDVIMDILPTDGGLVVETKIKPSDIAFVHTGLPAYVKLDAYDYAIYGLLRGRVSYVSPDALSEDSRAGEHIYYRVLVTVDARDGIKTAGGRDIEIQPGMTAQVEIHTGSMPVLTYLLKPVTKTLSTAFSER